MEKPTKRELARKVFDALDTRLTVDIDVMGGELSEICRGTPYEELARKALLQVEAVTMDDFVDAAGTDGAAEDAHNRLTADMAKSWAQVLWTLAGRDAGAL